MGVSEDKLLSCKCLMLDTILLLFQWLISSAWWAGMLRFIKCVLICYSDGVHFRSASVCCELLHPLNNMFHKDGLVWRYLLFQSRCLSPMLKWISECERSKRLRELLRNLLELRSRAWYRGGDKLILSSLADSHAYNYRDRCIVWIFNIRFLQSLLCEESYDRTFSGYRVNFP